MQRRFPGIIYIWVLVLLLVSTGLPERGFSQVSLDGNVQNYNAFQTSGDLLLITGRNHLQLQAGRTLSQGNLVFGGDLFHRYARDNESEFEQVELILRNAYADIFFDNADLRAGFQSITIGRSAGVFVTDILTPLDLREFPTLDPSDLRLGLAALNFTYYFGSNYLQFILSPGFQPHRIPEASSRWFPEPSLPDFLPVTYTREDSQEGLKNLNAALRYAWRSSLSLDLDLMLYHWSHPVPAYRVLVNTSLSEQFGTINLSESYLTTYMPGFSFGWRFADGFELQSESLFVLRRLFTYLPIPVSDLEQAIEDPVIALQLLPEFLPSDDGFVLEKPWLHAMLGMQYQTGSWTFLGQVFLEHIFRYEDKILPQEYFPYATAAIQKSYYRDRINSIVSGQYNFFANDFLIRADTEFEWRDDFFISAGINLFGGPDITPFFGHFSFSRFRQNSFSYVKIKTYF